MDMTQSIAPKSDQLNAEDLLAGPRTFTIEKVEQGTVEQPVNVHLTEFPGRPFKPSKTVRRIMVAAWGKDSAAYTGHRLTLYRDPAVKFGGMDVGGIRVSHMSHIDKRITVALTVSRGKRAPYVVEPLKDDAPAPAPANPNADLLAEIGKLADRLPGGRAEVAAEWADTHDGQSLRQATDLGGLELFRDDLASRIQ